MVESGDDGGRCGEHGTCCKMSMFAWVNRELEIECVIYVDEPSTLSA